MENIEEIKTEREWSAILYQRNVSTKERGNQQRGLAGI